MTPATMTPERLQQVKELFLTVLESEPARRATLLAESCAGDEELRAEVEALLAEQQNAVSFLETPAIEIEARLLAEAERPTMEGRVFGDYRLISLLGRGGMGEVYLAEDLRLGRQAALKFLPQHLLDDAERVRRFKREAMLASSFSHPNIVTIYEIDREETPRFIASEYVEGETLRQRLSGGALDLRDALDIAVQIASALKAAHAKGIIHRDIKPENIMLSGDGLVKVLDFSIAKLLQDQRVEMATFADSPEAKLSATRSGMLGTPGYMSPEQARGEAVDARTDIFSFGVLLYEMLAGRTPFAGENAAEIVNAILHEQPKQLRGEDGKLPADLERLVMKALRKEAGARHQTSAELQAELRALRDNVETAARLREQARHDSLKDDIAANPLLSEFAAHPKLQRLVRMRPQGIFPALAAAGWALAAILLSKYVGAACLRATVETNCEVVTQPQPVLFGYVVELNAGPLYLIGVPLMIMACFHLLRLSHMTLRLLVASERLVVAQWAGAGELYAPMSVIAERNRRLFRRLIPAYILFALVMSVGFEVPTWNRIAFGWVQAWKAQDLRGMDLRVLQQQNILSALPETTSLLKRNCYIQVSEVSGGHSRAEGRKWLWRHLIFVGVALGLQAMFIVFALWISTKVVFLFAMLSWALLDKPNQALRLQLDFADPEGRFGLSAMDSIYNSLLLLVLFDALILLLQQLANVPKGTSVHHGLDGWALIGQIAMLLSPLITLALVLLVPALTLLVLAETTVARHLEQLERERAVLRKELSQDLPEHRGKLLREKLDAMQQKLSLARRQRTWPRRNWFYRRLLLMSVALLFFVPFGIGYIKFLEGDTILLNLVRQMSERLCGLC